MSKKRSLTLSVHNLMMHSLMFGEMRWSSMLKLLILNFSFYLQTAVDVSQMFLSRIKIHLVLV